MLHKLNLKKPCYITLDIILFSSVASYQQSDQIVFIFMLLNTDSVKLTINIMNPVLIKDG